jgi:hypothetical protein
MTKPYAKQHSRETLLEQAYKNSVSYKITQATTLNEKRELVTEHNPTHYIFGKTLKPYKPWQTYEENMNQPNGETK